MNLTSLLLFRQILLTTLITSIILLGLLLLSELISIIHRVSDNFTFVDLILSAVYTLPSYFNQFLAIIVVISVVIGLGELAKTNELVIMRVSGISVWKLFAKASIAVFLITLLSFLNNQFVVPTSAYFYEVQLAKSKNQKINLNHGAPLNIKHENSIIYVGKTLDTNLLSDIRIISFNDQGEIDKITTAQYARFNQNQENLGKETSAVLYPWILQEVVVQKLENTAGTLAEPKLKIETDNLSNLLMPLPISANFFLESTLKPSHLSFSDLFSQIQFRKQNKLNYSDYNIEFWKRLTRPILLLSLLAISFPLILRFQREANLGKRMFAGIMLGLLVFIINEIIFNLAIRYRIPAELGVGLPMLIYSFVGVWQLKRLENN